MQFGEGVSRVPETGRAVEEALRQASSSLDAPPELAFLFATDHHLDHLEQAAEALSLATGPDGTSAGCIAQGVVAGAEELEAEPALSVWLASLPGARLRSSHLRAVRAPEGVAVVGWNAPEDPVGVVLLGDPRTFPAAGFVAGLARTHPGVPVVGGLAMGGSGTAALVHQGEVHEEGAVAVAIGGAVGFRTVVSQGCRPVGEPGVVTAASEDRILEIGGRPALTRLRQAYEGLGSEDRRLVQQGVQLGVVVDEYRTDFGRGDFLVRPVVGADVEEGSLSVGDHVPVGRTVQFQVRDPFTADEDLRLLLGAGPPADGVLLFTCNGRGRRFFGSPHHDASVVRELLAPSAVAGFFAAGELGPVGGENFLHGYTATLAEFRPPDDST